MKRTICATGFLLFITCILSGCVYSIHPLNDGVPATVESALPGTWVTQDKDGKKELMTIRAVKQAYEVDYAEPDSGRVYRYEANLVRIDDFLFADALLKGDVKPDGKMVEVPGGAVALHVFVKVSLEGDALRMALLKQDWVRKQLEDKKIVVAHEDFDEDTTILTAPPPQLREFLKGIATIKEAFGDTDTFNRKK
ncbi:MAG: hypothetical protein WBP79_05030 [Candidatus Acidiferrales bacterium]